MITAAGLFFLCLLAGAAAAGGAVYAVLWFVDWRLTRYEPKHGIDNEPTVSMPIPTIGVQL